MNFLMNQRGRNSLISIRNSWIVKVTWKEILKKRGGKCIVDVLVCPSLQEHPRRPRGGQSGRDKRRRKFSRTGERDPGVLLLKKPVPRLMRVLFSDWAQKSEASIYRAAFVIFLCKGVNLQTRLFGVPVWLVQESFQNWTQTKRFSLDITLRTDLGH